MGLGTVIIAVIVIIVIMPVMMLGCSDEGQQDGFGHRGCPSGCGTDQVCLDGACQPVGPDKDCGSETYGSGLAETGVIYVDGSQGGAGDGTEAKPFSTIGEALAALSAESETIAVAAGTYEEELTIDRTVALRCRCSSEVTIAGTIVISPPAAGGDDVTVTIDGCRVAPAGFAAAATDWGACTGNEEPKGITATGINHRIALLIRDSVISGWCTGIYFNVAHGLANSALCVSRTRIFANVRGIDVQGAPTATLNPLFEECQGLPQAVATELSQVDQNRDFGIYTRLGAQGIALRGNIVTASGRIGSKSVGSTDGSFGYGVFLGNTESAQVTANLIANNENCGLAMSNLDTLLATDIVIDGNTLLANGFAGIALHQLQAEKAVQITDNLIQKTSRRGDGEGEGDGIQVSVKQGKSYDVTVQNNTIEDSERNGILLDGVGGAISGNRVQGSGTYGVLLQQSTASVGDNGLDGNAAGDVHTVDNPIDKIGALPVPLP